MKAHWIGLGALVGAVLIFPVVARADLARDYSAVPVDSWYPAYYFSYTESRAAGGASKVVSAANLFRITQTVDIFGRCGGWNVIVPYEWLTTCAVSDQYTNETYYKMVMRLP